MYIYILSCIYIYTYPMIVHDMPTKTTKSPHLQMSPCPQYPLQRWERWATTPIQLATNLEAEDRGGLPGVTSSSPNVVNVVKTMP
jgi:hypothetical protein